MAHKIPATIITGFLGVGKTSMVRHLMAHANRCRIALIINEFGELGIDGEILRACGIEGCADENIMELANGCICCTVADDFIPTMESLLDRPLPPERIVIETSGLALPKPLVKAFNWPDIRTRVTVDGVVTVVDGPAVAQGLFATDVQAVQAQREADDALEHESPLEELYEEQLACADLVVINKTDLLDAKSLRHIVMEVNAKLRPSVGVLKSSYGKVSPTVLLGLAAAAEDDLEARPSHHDDGEEHDHDDFVSFSVELPAIDSPSVLVSRLQSVVADFGVLRVKGFAAVTGKNMRLLIQGVGDRFHHYYDRDWTAEEQRRTRLVVIGETGLDEKAVRVALGL